MGLNGNDGLNAKELFRMITINGAKNLKMDDTIGSLTEGKFANYNLVDLNNVNFFTYQLKSKTFFPLLIQRTKPENIKKIIFGGNIIYERKF
jgi:cytosine/adenosine deaminase-related metal-dependent hydrolase